jgi:hypothetical protein
MSQPHNTKQESFCVVKIVLNQSYATQTLYLHNFDQFQMENLCRNAAMLSGLPVDQPGPLPASKPRDEFQLFPLGTRGEKAWVNVKYKCLTCLRIQISGQGSTSGYVVFS